MSVTVNEPKVSTSIAARGKRVANAVFSGDGRQLRSYAIRLGLNPELAYPAARTLKFMRRPDQYFRRLSALDSIPRNPALNGIFNKRTGWGTIPIGAIPGFDAMANTLRKLKEERASSITHDYYIKMIFSPEDMDAYPEVRNFVLSDELIQIAADYLGTVPILQTAQGWYTPVNSGLESSQLFHRDGIDYRQAKFVFNISDMKRSNGPFEFLPADTSDRVSRGLKKWRGRLTDDKIFEHCSPDDVVSTAGPSGSGFAVDGCRCFHYGGRSREGERLVLLLSFGSYYGAMSAACSVAAEANWYPNDELRQRVLGLR